MVCVSLTEMYRCGGLLRVIVVVEVIMVIPVGLRVLLVVVTGRTRLDDTMR